MRINRSPRISAAVGNRRQRILELLSQNGELGVDDLAKFFNISEISVRRDLRYLAEREFIQRSHGAALPMKPKSVVEELYSEREGRRPEAKREIGRIASTLLKDERSLVINDGTTTMQVALELAAFGLPRSITTNAVNIALELANVANIEVSLQGGIVRRSSFATFSPRADEGLGKFSTAVIGVEALSQDGIFLGHQFDVEMARRFMSCSARTLIVADSSKWLVAGNHKTASWDQIFGLVTEELPPASMLKVLKRQNIEIFLP
jgi:DeoR/GlpR family transcriptional regulator of sugar metabolism